MLLMRFAAQGHCYDASGRSTPISRFSSLEAALGELKYVVGHVLTQGSRQRIAKRANCDLVRLCAAVRLVRCTKEGICFGHGQSVDR